MADLILPSSLAVWDPLGGTPEPSMTGHDGVCVHTMAGTYVGTDSWFHQNGWSGTESTVGVAGDGRCKQWVPWNRQADANLEGNSRWLSIECADLGENFPPSSTWSDESPPLTDAQVDQIVDLCVYWCRKETHAVCPSTWRCHNEGIPARFIATSCERGIGCHRHGIDPWRDEDCPRWSLASGKVCPRSVRFRQVRDVIVPRVRAALGAAPTIPELEEAEMLVCAPEGSSAIFLFAAGKITGLKSMADVEGLKNAGVGVWKPTSASWAVHVNAHGPIFHQ
jgi:hypothetical protein